VFIVLENAPRAEVIASGLRWEQLAASGTSSKFDLSLALSADSGGLRGRLEYSTDLFYPQTATRLASQLEVLAEAAAVNPDRPISCLALLPAAEREPILRGFD